MTDKPVMINVTIDGLQASMRSIKPGKRGYEKARKNMILRERDAIALFNQLATQGQTLDGAYSFQSLDMAKTFAFLHLKSIEHQIATNLDLVQGYRG
jgi:hypothetical protein